MVDDEIVPVLIVGGGPVGLSCAVFLCRYGVHPLLVERHRGTSIHPRARGLNYRTMEIFRREGLEQAIRIGGSALAGVTWFLIVETLAGRELQRFRVNLGEQDATHQLSPTRRCMCAQDELEPVLLMRPASDRQVFPDILHRRTALRQRVKCRGLAAMRLAADRPLRRVPVREAPGWPLREWQLNSKPSHWEWAYSSYTPGQNLTHLFRSPQPRSPRGRQQARSPNRVQYGAHGIRGAPRFRISGTERPRYRSTPNRESSLRRSR